MHATPEESVDEFRIDRSHLSVERLTEPDDALVYWLTRPVEERLQAVELLRTTFYGASAGEGLQRVLEVAQLTPR
jgi:hypothetical protein